VSVIVLVMGRTDVFVIREKPCSWSVLKANGRFQWLQVFQSFHSLEIGIGGAICIGCSNALVLGAQLYGYVQACPSSGEKDKRMDTVNSSWSTTSLF